jgi:dTDP-4-dehydrorhamnose 3,5-epimerase-like enzyme
MTAKILDFPKIVDQRGSLTFLQNPQFIPFEIQRVFWINNGQGNAKRGGHAYKQQEQVIIALSGSFDVIITNTNGSTQKFSLNQPCQGLYVPPLTWCHLENFSANSVGLYLSSQKYNAEDYINEIETLKTIA